MYKIVGSIYLTMLASFKHCSNYFPIKGTSTSEQKSMFLTAKREQGEGWKQFTDIPMTSSKVYTVKRGGGVAGFI